MKMVDMSGCSSPSSLWGEDRNEGFKSIPKQSESNEYWNEMNNLLDKGIQKSSRCSPANRTCIRQAFRPVRSHFSLIKFILSLFD